MATLKELSDSTGYSPATISRILTGDPSLTVSDEARKRVLEEAGRLDYAATRSRRGRTPKMLLQVGVAEMLTPEQQLADPYYLYLRNFVEQACAERRYAFLPLERRGEEGFAPPEGTAPDGIIALGIFTRAQQAALSAVSPNLVFLDSSPDEARFDSVVLNYALGIRLALDHLLSLGHTRIGFIGPSEKLGDCKEPAPEVRRSCFISMMEERGLLDASLLVEAPMESRATAAAVSAFLDRRTSPPTAFLAANEENAMGASRALEARGLSVPGDVSLVSFNDTPLSQLMTPPLTSVSTHADEMARTAVGLLGERAASVAGRPVRTLPQKVVVPPTLAVRKSTAPPARR